MITISEPPATGVVIKSSTISAILTNLRDTVSGCSCNCNYSSCPCNCNHCSCNCNYCTCNCNWGNCYHTSEYAKERYKEINYGNA